MILFFGFLVGLLVAWLLGAKLSRMDQLDLRGAPFIFTALAIELALFLPGLNAISGAPVRGLNAVSYSLVCAFMVANLRRPGFALAALGALLNSLVILANRGLMPVSGAAWRDSGRALSLFADGRIFANNVLADHTTHLGFLGDVFAIPHAVPLATPISIGDLLIVGGAVIFIYRACTPTLSVAGSHPLAPLRVSAYRHLMTARVASAAGDWISLTAVVTWLYAEYHSTLAVTAFMVARILAASLGGLIAARGYALFGQYRILTIVEAVRGVITALMIPAAAAHQPLLVVTLASLSSLIGAATRPGATSLIPLILPVEALQAGNAIHGVSRNLVMIAATFTSAFAFIHYGIGAALAIDVSTFVFATIAYQTYARKEIQPAPPDEHTLWTLRQQVGWISRSRVCATLIGSFAIATAAIGLFNATLPAFMAHHLHQHAGYGVALGFIGVGFTLGEGATAFIHRESVARRSIALAFIGNGAALWLVAHTGTLPTAFLALAMLGTFDGTTEVVFDTLIQRATPQRLQASVFALAGVFQNVAMTVGLLAAPLVVTYARPSTAVTIGGAGCALAALAAAVGLHSRKAHMSEHDSLHDAIQTPAPAQRESGFEEPPRSHGPHPRRLVGRLLRIPVRHLASVTSINDRYTPICICGWEGDSHTHRGEAFSQAHVHTRHVQIGRDGSRGATPLDPVGWFADLDSAATNEPWQLTLVDDRQANGDDPRAVRRFW